jgi:hypothetical protein
MRRKYTKAYKKSKTNWSDYQFHERDLSLYKRFGRSPGLEDIFIDHNPYLKRRVWRNMRKVRREGAKSKHHTSMPRLNDQKSSQQFYHSAKL